MEFSKPYSSAGINNNVLVLVMALTSLMMIMLPVYGQINTPCSPTMLNTFTPCMNFLTNSTGSGASPSAGCCNSLKALTGSGMSCVCLIVTGGVPFQIPINRTLAISLPRACNMPGVPVQCKAAAGAPIPAPGPISPGASPTLSPQGSIVPEPTPSAESPESDDTPALTPPSTTAGTGVPTDTTGSRPVLTPSAANPSYSFSPLLVVLAIGFTIFKCY